MSDPEATAGQTKAQPNSEQSSRDRSPIPASLYVTEHHHYPFGLRPHHLHLVNTAGQDIEWQSRRARKRRYAARPHHVAAKLGDTATHVLLRIPGKDRLKPHLLVDVSFWIAIAFTLGSAVWVINGFLVWLPFIYPSVGTDVNNKAAAALAFLGGTIFNIGSYLMVVEALDRGRETNFGTALAILLHSISLHPKDKQKDGQGMSPPTKIRPGEVVGPDGARGFTWWGRPLWHELGYTAAFVQLCAASTFWISTLTGLPGLIPGMSDGRHVAVTDVFFWTPQVVGGTGFITSSLMLMVEVQHHWWLPRPLDLGWQVGFWNLIGSVGFTLCGALGYSHNHGVEYESGLATFWGSWAFLIGSVLQIWEVSFREPPEE